VRRPTWRFWAAVAAVAALYAVLGYWLSGSATAEEWLYRTGLTAAAILPVAFVAIYTAIGLWTDTPAKWWKDEIGASLVIAALSLVPLAAPLAWVFWFDGGSLRASWIAWLEVSGPCVSALAWLRLCIVWVRTAAAGRHAGGAHEVTATPPGGA
jgi:hypothetical protein